jgi:hypothetical protein
MNEEQLPWERLPDETAKAFRAFSHYRDSNPDNRSFLRTYREVSKLLSAKRVSGRFLTWAKLYKWVERTQQYDAHLEGLKLKINEDEHVGRIEEHRKRQERLATAAVESSIQALLLANRGLKLLLDDPNLKITASNLGTLLRSAAAVAELGTRAESQALGVEELLRSIAPDEGE